MLFKSFCLSVYMDAHNLTGKEAIRIFKEYKVFDYIETVKDVLHSTGEAYIVGDIDEYIAARKAV